ncbi:fungal specific transcription factor domain-containing protein [Histoplasma capsulatum G186AR]|uniref:Fungal specific transcription factor domain-containing protein n=2 Tax=Ajellomyces capsulatus TaxID=5037 RepID=C0NA73_AJECG|nr:fungal specific transcription factor domain-containing protein [Histoplasma capsulatum G186AR]EEH10564.1 fungal specific transcription factor domain-containing protein [Histoplasma capsulatum G186AR]KAG5288448.1 fungal specific transcription factor domain-containing protein [Histoplasma capsulatum]QSS71024.1 fungal specific transcription factor domain-containing protein [Histoplasma capsulatum G186AR]
MATNTLPPNIHPQKRKNEDHLRPSTRRPVQKRASAACRSCRARKVRCDVLLKSTPCTNCRLDGAECIIAESKRTRFARTADGTTILIGNPRTYTDNNDGNAGIVAPNNDLIESSGNPSVEQNNDYDSSSDCESRQQKSPADPIIAHDMILTNMFSIMNQLFGPAPESMRREPDIDLPRFIKQSRVDLEINDLNYLQKKGAFEIPHFAFRNALLKSFVNYVHVYMPFLDLKDFLQTIYENTGRKRISLLLFQAVMFAGTAFVNMKHLRMAGYESRRAARKAFFQRVRALYDQDYEEEPIVIIQTLMLMSYWMETAFDQKDCFHWIGISLALARLNGMHFDATSASMDLDQRRIWRRTWWILYSRDKMIALGLRRPIRLRDGEHDLDMINLDDFDLQPFPTHLWQMIGASEVLNNPEYQRVLALLFIEKIKLCNHLHRALILQYPTPAEGIEMMRAARMALIPKQVVPDVTQIRHLDEGLDTWFANSPQETRYSPQFGCQLSEGEEVLHVHRAMLRLIYLATRSTLHLPKIIRALPNKLQPIELHRQSLEKVRHAAAGITSITQDLQHLNLIRYLPSNGTTPLLSAIAMFVIDTLVSPGSSIKLSSINGLHQCLRTIVRLREIYPIADDFASAVEMLIRNISVHQHLEYLHNPLSIQDRTADCFDLTSAMTECYGPASEPKTSPPSLKILDSIICHPRMREGSSASSSDTGTSAEIVRDIVYQDREHYGFANIHANANAYANANVNATGNPNETGFLLGPENRIGGGYNASTSSSSYSSPGSYGHCDSSTNTLSSYAVNYHMAQVPFQSANQADPAAAPRTGAGIESEPQPLLQPLPPLTEPGRPYPMPGQGMDDQSIQNVLSMFSGHYPMYDMGYTQCGDRPVHDVLPRNQR